ncbi:hypothetical protein BKA83DRAFT_4261276 [Pisolithus microcarpus]|nr:hypothetical protein BKA83DRAFT_4261276 [Pisolithus microcarpus]
MAVISLPLTFTNSFWTQDYRKGLEVLYGKLEQGVAENDEIVAFILARAQAENQLANALLNPPTIGSPGTGFDRDDGASLLMTFRGLQDESIAQGKIHKEIAKDLQTIVAEPFNEWARMYKEQVSSSKGKVLHSWVRAYEDAQKEVIKLKHSYLTKTRKADEAEDESRFAPGSDVSDHYTTSPHLAPRDATRTPQRSTTVTERISQRFKEIQRKATGSISSTTNESDAGTDVAEGDKELSKVDKGKGRATELSSPPPMSPPLPPAKLDTSPQSQPPAGPVPILMAGVPFSASAISTLLARAAAQMPLRPVRFPLLGEYSDCFSGAEFVEWLNKNVPAFEGNLDVSEEAARELIEREGILRRVGEFGNGFEHADDAYYQFRPKAFDLEGKTPESVNPPKRSQIADNLLKRSNNLVNVVTKALNATSQNEPAYVRLRQEAEEADKMYRVAVRKLDRQRLGLEERIEEVLKALQRGEAERLRAVKTVLHQYQGTLANLPKALEPTLERSATFITTYQPESDLTALIERYRTGPFRPVAKLYESVAHDESDVVFGIDLRKWAEGGWSALTSGEEKKDYIPPVLTALLNALRYAYVNLPDDNERRKSWIYDVPLPALHHLRESLNAVPPDQPFSQEMLARFDAPILAGCVKLWALELDPPLMLWEGWDEIRKLYPTVGSFKVGDGASEQQHVQDLQAALLHVPKVNLFVLDAIVTHLHKLIDTTSSEEDDDVYITKLALSVGRTIIRPKVETELSIQDRHPTLLLIDLLKNYDSILPPTIERKKRESERRVPVRKRTAPVDMRISRGKLSVGSPSREILAAQELAAHKAPAAASAPAVESGDGSGGLRAQVTAEPKSIESAPVPETDTDTETKAVAPEPEPEHENGSPPSVAEDPSVPPRPTFREPPPEVDDLPPRPSFKEPPPELDDGPYTQPSFVSPPSSPPRTTPPIAEEKPVSPAVAVTPATPQNPIKALRRHSAVRSGSTSPARSSSPSTRTGGGGGTGAAADDQPLNSGRSGLSRHTSGQNAVRGPRITRGPRTPGAGGASVSSMVANFNNRTGAVSPPPRSSSPGLKRTSGVSAGAGSRPSSMLGGSGAHGRGVSGGRGGFSRRTMASDAEDDVVDK